MSSARVSSIVVALIALSSFGFGAAPSFARKAVMLPTKVELVGLQGGSVVRKDLRGKTVVMQFFASWCVGCGEVMGTIAPMMAAHPDARYLPVSLDETMGDAKDYFKRQKAAVRPLERTAVLDRDAKLATALNVEALPAIVVVDGDGKMVASYSGHPSAAQMAELKDLLAE